MLGDIFSRYKGIFLYLRLARNDLYLIELIPAVGSRSMLESDVEPLEQIEVGK
jgi:hypothetical protein